MREEVVMRYWRLKRDGVSVLLVLGLLAAGQAAWAQEQPSAAGSESAAQGAPVIDDAALESANKRLQEAEAELMKLIDAQEKSGPPAAAGDGAKASLRVETQAPAPKAQPTLNNLSREVAGEMETLHSNNASLKSEVNSKVKSITSLNNDNAALRARLAVSERQNDSLLAKMKEMRNQLLIAETEIVRLSSMIEDRNRTTLARYTGESGKIQPPAPIKKPTLLTEAQQQKSSEDMPIATVMVDNANLRSGPGANNSPIMSVSKGTRLAIEARQGDWYRVIAPTGSRAWIDAKIVNFGKNLESTPTRTVKVQGYDSSVERQAFEFIRGDMPQ